MSQIEEIKQSVVTSEPFPITLSPFEINGILIDPIDSYVVNLLPRNVCIKEKILPFSRIGDNLLVAIVSGSTRNYSELFSHPLDQIIFYPFHENEIEDALRRIFGNFFLDNDHETNKTEQPLSLERKSDSDAEKVTDNPLTTISINATFGEFLVAKGLITQEELRISLDRQQDEANGARIGEILLEQGLINYWNIAEAFSWQKRIPLYNLLTENVIATIITDQTLSPIWGLITERFWYDHLIAPIGVDDTHISIAMVDPNDLYAIDSVKEFTQREPLVYVTGYRDIMALLNQKYLDEHRLASHMALLSKRPEDSAMKQINRPQAWILFCLLVLTVVGFYFLPKLTGTIFAGIIEAIYATVSIFRLWAMANAVSKNAEVYVTKADMKKIPPTSLPEYTILVPLYKEASVLPTLSKAMRDLQYPKDRLDVKFLLEEDDIETIEACKQAHLPAYVELLIVPQSEPRTKPKACNYGLTKARGKYIVIYDAEDIPEADQLLKAITVFRQSDDTLACVQAKLSYYNENQNVLTRWFTAEYANWFELLLPSLYSQDMPVPLGGTSNHLRTDTLRELGAWDPFNVAEDADLGVRLHKAGYRTAVMDSVTFEEANSDFVNWIRQRSRWVKGYLQTWLVHMRHPIKLYKELGLIGFLGYQMTIGGTPLQFLINPILWVITVLWFLFQPIYMKEIFSGWVYYLGNLCLFLGNTAFILANLVGVYKAKRFSLAIWALFTPVYWVFMSIASFKALNQLIFKPSYWEKTVHGLAKGHEMSLTQK